jgi:CRISPR-associated endonuclease Csy4
MHHYIDIRISDNQEFSPHIVMNMAFERLHLALADMKSDNIGVSFPDADGTCSGLGKVLRMHGDEKALSDVSKHRFISVIRDYALIDSVHKIPDVTSFYTVRRVQEKSNPERLRRRQMKRHGLTEEQAKERIPDSAAKFLELPFIILNSKSTGQKFRLYIRQMDADSLVFGSFSTYGLSGTATLPKF